MTTRFVGALVDAAFVIAIGVAVSLRLFDAAKLGALMWIGVNAMRIRVVLEQPDRGCALWRRS